MSVVFDVPAGLALRGRIKTKERRCPHCRNPFSVLPRGVLCTSCGATPKRLFIDFPLPRKKWPQYQGRLRVYSGPSGVLDGWNAALSLLISINAEWDRYQSGAGKFDPEKWAGERLRVRRFSPLWQEYLAAKWKDVERGELAGSGVRKYAQRGRDFVLPFFQDMDVRDIDRSELVRFRESLPDRLGSSTKNTILEHVKAFLSWLVVEHEGRVIDKVPTFPKPLRRTRKAPRWLDRPEFEEILSFVTDPRRRLAIRVAYETGMRIGEVRALKGSDLRQGRVLVERTMSDDTLRGAPKDDDPRDVDCPADLYADLAALAKTQHPEAFLFAENGEPYKRSILSDTWNAAVKRAGYPPISLKNATRHSWATREKLRIEAEALRGVSGQLGHAGSQVTREHYLGTVGSKVKKAGSVKKIGE